MDALLPPGGGSGSVRGAAHGCWVSTVQQPRKSDNHTAAAGQSPSLPKLRNSEKPPTNATQSKCQFNMWTDAENELQIESPLIVRHINNNKRPLTPKSIPPTIIIIIIIIKRRSGINPIPPTVIDRDYKETSLALHRDVWRGVVSRC